MHVNSKDVENSWEKNLLHPEAAYENTTKLRFIQYSWEIMILSICHTIQFYFKMTHDFTVLATFADNKFDIHCY